ncbi:MAG: hypothetical protein KCHDKBKB_02871 [Elusimicrobia bacterium]|nr:hypothetical protein [Elusimicrobiota bacterium]
MPVFGGFFVWWLYERIHGISKSKYRFSESLLLIWIMIGMAGFSFINWIDNIEYKQRFYRMWIWIFYGVLGIAPVFVAPAALIISLPLSSLFIARSLKDRKICEACGRLIQIKFLIRSDKTACPFCRTKLVG